MMALKRSRLFDISHRSGFKGRLRRPAMPAMMMSNLGCVIRQRIHLLAHLIQTDGHRGCPFIGVNRNTSIYPQNDATDPKRTFGAWQWRCPLSAASVPRGFPVSQPVVIHLAFMISTAPGV